MNLFPKIASTEFQNWQAPDLDADLDGGPATPEQSEQILALFGTGQKPGSRRRESGLRSTLHSNGASILLAAWQPGDLLQPPQAVTPETWDFVETSADSFKTADPLSVKNRSEAEKEKAKLLRDARERAEQILRTARAEADRILHQAQVDAEQMKQNGYEQGATDARHELQGALAATHVLVQETHQWQASLLKDGEHLLLSMLKELAQNMFGDGVRLDDDALQINLNRIMENAQRLGDLNIFLNPRDANLLDASWSDYQHLITGNKVRIIPSEKIKPGGCIIKGNMGMVDARVETQLAAILRTIDETSEVSK